MPLRNSPKVTELTDEEIQRRIHAFEETHGMSSRDFLVQYNSGQLDDRHEFIRWAGLLSLANEVGVKISVFA